MLRDPTTLRRRRAAVAGAFFVRGLLFISLTLRLPLVQRTFDVDEVQLSGLMLLMVLLAGLRVGPRGAGGRSGGQRRDPAVRDGGPGPRHPRHGRRARQRGMTPFVVGLAVYGTALGAVDATCNMQAVALEHRLDRPILPSSHGARTAGGLLATIIALTLPGLDPSRAAMAVAVVPLLVVGLPLLGRDATPAAPATPVDIPWRAVVMVGLGLVLFYMVDTATTAWGPVYLASPEVFADPPTSSQMVALATLPYPAATMLARLAGDRLTARFGAPALVRTGAVIASIGLLVVVPAPASVWPVAVLGFFVTGLGVAVIAPLSFSAAAAIAGHDVDPAQRRARVDAVIARFNQFNYVGALLGAVLTGAIGGISLRIGFAVPALLVLGMLPLARHFAGTRRRREPHP
uniref:MFS transporter n=1 Tax=Janibacter limosus TaxID=53458 RepID=A0AC61U5X2_9MICO|nr:MFS transporter [Janibacter limosus]